MLKTLLKISLAAVLVFNACQTTKKNTTIISQKERKFNFPDDIWLSEKAQISIDSVFTNTNK